jgi:peroxiredoxin
VSPARDVKRSYSTRCGGNLTYELSITSLRYLRRRKIWLLRFGLASFLLLGLLFLLWSCSTKNLIGTEKSGSIFVDSNVTGALIDLNDVPTEKQTPDTLENIPVGKHKVSVRKEGYNSVPQFDSVEVTDRGLTAVDFFLTSKLGAISVDSDPQGAHIILDEVKTQKITPDTLDSVPVGKHVVSVEKEGYKPFPEFDTMEVVEDSVSTAGFVLTERVGDIFVNSNVGGAKIVLDHVSTGKTTPDTIYDVMVGEHLVSVIMPGYSIFPESAVVEVIEGSVTIVNFVLNQEVGGLYVNSTPQGAEIYLNHENTGESTPYFFNLPEGRYVVSVTKPGYSVSPESLVVQVIKDSPVTVDFVLTENKGSIFVTSTPSGANITLDHVFTGKTTPDTLFDISLGEHVVSVEKPGYLPSPESLIVTVYENQTSLAEFILLDTLYGSLSVSSNVNGATIVIDNQTTDRTTPHTYFNFVPIGTHIVSVFKEAYSNDAPAKEVVDVKTGDTIVVGFNLSPASVGPDTEGQRAPDFGLEDDYGDSIRLYNYRGFVVIVMFWANSCPFCLLELDFLQDQYEKYSADSLMIFAVNYEDALFHIQQKRSEKGLTYHLLVGKGSQMVEDYNFMRDGVKIKDPPITIIIDRTGLTYCWVQGYNSATRARMRQALSDLFGHD